MPNFLKKPSTKYIFIALAVLVGGYLVFGRGHKTESELVVVKKGSITQEVSVTGRVKPTDEVSLAFEKSGKIAEVTAKVGDKVEIGQVIVALQADDLYAQLNQARAGVEVARAELRQYQAVLEGQQAKLRELQKGTRTEELQISETNFANAQKTLADAQANFDAVTKKTNVDLANVNASTSDVLADAYAKADDAVRIKTASIVTAGNGGNSYRINFNSCDSQVENDALALRPLAETELLKWKNELIKIADSSIQKAAAHLSLIKKSIDAVNGLLITQCTLNDPARNADRTNVNLAEIDVNAAIAAVSKQQQTIESQKVINFSALTTAQSKLNDAKNALKSAKDQLTLKKAGNTIDQIAIQNAQVRQAKANVEAQRAQVSSARASQQNAEAQLAKSIIISPIFGIITKNDAKIGEIANPNKVIVSVISTVQYEIDSNVPEVDIGRVALQNPVKITLDALPDDKFTGKVIAIDPAETVIDGVINFKITVVFDKTDLRLKSGLTANLDIETAHKDDILVLPQYAITENDKGAFVKKNGKRGILEEIQVQLGIRSQDGNSEIISGVSEGDSVLNIGSKSAKK